jgi:hypothetical protein
MYSEIKSDIVSRNLFLTAKVHEEVTVGKEFISESFKISARLGFSFVQSSIRFEKS